MKDLIAKLIKERFTAKNFCTSFEAESHSYDISVTGVGPIRFPVQPKLAKQLIEHSVPSKFGLKEETLYDPSVRKSFEIGAEKIQLGPVFQKQLNMALDKIKKDLLFPATSSLSAELHNMLIYEKGCFFDFHQDSEKKDGMMASLVVVLPSNYRGGELVIEYQGHKKTLPERSRYGRNAGSDNLTFMAFYADCQHRINKLTYGYRTALTFNLILENPQELKNNKEHAKTISALQEYFATQENLPSYGRDKPKWFVYLLNHQYTPKALSWKTLKGVDKEAAAVFKQAAEELGLDVYLTLADIQETWNVVDDYYYGKPHNIWNNEDDSVNDSSELELDYLVNNEIVLINWLDKDGKNVPDFAHHCVHDSMVFMSQDNSKYEPESSQHEGYMGNYGNTLDRWYKRTAIVLWPKKISLGSKFAIDRNIGVKELLQIAKANADAGIVAYESIKSFLQSNKVISRIDMEHLIELAIALNTHEHLKEIFSACTIKKILQVNIRQMSKLLQHLGDKAVSHSLLMVEKSHENATDKEYYDILSKIYKDYPQSSKILLNLWLEKFEYDSTLSSGRVDNIEQRDAYISNTQQNLVFLAGFLSEIDEKSKLEKIFNVLHKNKEMLGEISLYEILHHKKLSQIFDVLPKYKALKKEALHSVKLILGNQPIETDWTIDELPKCSCELCVLLKEFLSCDSISEKRWPLSEERRQHIHNIINQLDPGQPFVCKTDI